MVPLCKNEENRSSIMCDCSVMSVCVHARAFDSLEQLDSSIINIASKMSLTFVTYLSLLLTLALASKKSYWLS